MLPVCRFDESPSATPFSFSVCAVAAARKISYSAWSTARDWIRPLPVVWGANSHAHSPDWPPRVINFKFPLQPHQKYNITQLEELPFQSFKVWLYFQFSLHSYIGRRYTKLSLPRLGCYDWVILLLLLSLFSMPFKGRGALLRDVHSINSMYSSTHCAELKPTETWLFSEDAVRKTSPQLGLKVGSSKASTVGRLALKWRNRRETKKGERLSIASWTPKPPKGATRRTTRSIRPKLAQERQNKTRKKVKQAFYSFSETLFSLYSHRDWAGCGRGGSFHLFSCVPYPTFSHNPNANIEAPFSVEPKIHNEQPIRQPGL